MKFYDLTCADSDARAEESKTGRWATRADAEQVEKDAVGMAKIVRDERIFHLLLQKDITTDKVMEDKKIRQAEAIIERYEGGK